MGSSTNRLKRLIVEIHRRSLWQVLLIYVGGAWVCYEIIDTITDRLALPEWLPVLAIILFLIGLPVVLATALTVPRHLVLIALIGLSAAESLAQTTSDRVAALLARGAQAASAGDTARAIAVLQAAVDSLPGQPELLAELAWLYAAQGSDVTTDYADRRTAERYAVAAWRLDPGDPKALAALAQVRFKQYMTSAAGRFLERVVTSPRFEAAPAAFQTEVHRLRGQVRARQVRNFEGLVWPSQDFAVSTPECAWLGVFCLNFTRPVSFNEWLANAPSLESLAADERGWMLEAYQAAVATDSTHLGALGELLLALADMGAWEEYERYARRGVRSNPGAAEPQLWLGLALHRRGRTVEAAEVFARGLELLPDRERLAYTDPLPLLTVEDSARVAELVVARGLSAARQVWARSDPLYLTELNERWVEHLARVVYADLKFAPTGGRVRGSQTEPGRIHVRYGPPRVIWSVQRDQSKELDSGRMLEVLNFLARCAGAEIRPPPDCYVMERAIADATHGGGRWIFWNYEPDRPSFVFTRDLEMSNLRFMDDSYSQAYAEEVRARLPSHYQPFALLLEVPHQLARFKGEGPGEAVVESYAALALGELVGAVTDSVEVGTFFFDAEHTESYRWQGRVSAREDTLAFRARTVLPSGRYEYAIEAYDRHANRAALGRGQLMIPTYGADTLVLSDLLVADAIRRKRTPAEVRGDLQIWGSADLAFGEGEPVGLYWEVYGLATLEGIARYEVTLEVRDAEQRSLPVRVLDAIASVFAGGPEERPQLSWSREVALVDRDRAIDWIMLGGIAEGQQRIVVTLRDLVSGRRTATERQLLVVPREKE